MTGAPSPSRPSMPDGYGIAAPDTGSGLLQWSRAAVRAAESRNYWIVTASPSGRPHAMPVWGVWLDDTVYFSTDPASRKGRNLAINPRLVVHLESGDDAVILEGEVERVTDPDTLERFCDAYVRKYDFRPDPSNPGQGVYRLVIQKAFGWLESDFPGGATRWTFTPSGAT